MIATKEQKNEVAVIEKESNKVLGHAKTLDIKSQEDYDKAAQFIKAVKLLQKKVNETFGPIVSKAYAAWKEAKAQEKKHLDPLVEAEQIVKRASIGWYEEQERIRQDKERKEREAADAAEKKRKKELKSQAKGWEEKGNTEKAEERRAAAEQVHVAPRPVLDTAQKAVGQSIKENWKADVTDLRSLVKAVADGRAPLNFLTPDMTVINRQAKATKDSMKFDGIKFYVEKVMAVR